MDHSVEDYDEYEEYEEYEGDDQEDDEGEEYEEVEDPKPTKEELEYLELRQRLKEQFRKPSKKDGGSGMNTNDRKKLPYDNFGSFFGPSRPVISQRVIQESKSLLENQQLTSRVSDYLHGDKKSHVSNSAAPKPRGPPKVINEKKTKAQKLKDTRDYSFLFSEDAQLPAPTKEPTSQHGSVPSTEARSAHIPVKSKQPLGNRSQSLHGIGGQKDKKSVPMNGQLQSRNKLATAGNANSLVMKSKKQVGSNNGIGPGRPVGPKVPPSVMQKRPSLPGMKNSVLSAHKPLPSKRPLDRKQESAKARVAPHQPVSLSKSQINKPQKQTSQIKPQKQISSRPALSDQRSKKRPARAYSDDDEDGNAISLIRQMFRYNPDRYSGEDDVSDMEANFNDILEEEKRSARLARKEDQEQLRLIQEEEERERRAKLKRLKKA